MDKTSAPETVNGTLYHIKDATKWTEATAANGLEMRVMLKPWPPTLYLMAEERYIEIDVKSINAVISGEGKDHAASFRVESEAQNDVFKGTETTSVWLAAKDESERDEWVAALDAAMQRVVDGWEPEPEEVKGEPDTNFHTHAGHNHAGHNHAGHNHAGHNHAPGQHPIRFKVGTKVYCNTGVWSSGEVVALNYKEDEWPEGKTVPYQVRLDDGGLIFAPVDEDYVIRLNDGSELPPIDAGHDEEPEVDDALKTPVTVITGFLGAGKTTLVNYILTNKEHGLRIAIIENEFGAINIDQELVEENVKTKENLVTMQNGCICCTVRGDLINAMQQLAERRDQIDAVIIETTGLADPGPVCVTFKMPQLKSHFRVDGIVCMVDTKYIESHLKEERPQGAVNESAQQLGFADKILLNKMDLVSREEVAQVKKTIRQVNGFAEMIETSQSKVPLTRILGISAFDPDRALNFNAVPEADEMEVTGTTNATKHDLTGVGSMGLIHEGVLPDEKFAAWFNGMLMDENFAINLYRCKGVLCLDSAPEVKWVFQGVHDNLMCKKTEVKWEKGEKILNKIVFIGRGLDQEKIENTFYEMLGVEKPVPSGSLTEMFVEGELAECNIKDISKLLEKVAGVESVKSRPVKEPSGIMFSIFCSGSVSEGALIDAPDTFGWDGVVVREKTGGD